MIGHRSFVRASGLALLLASRAFAAAGPSPSAAAPTAVTAPLTLREVVVAALRHHPELAAFEPKLRAQQARTRMAGLDPALQLSFDLANALGSGETSGVNAVEATLALSRVIELGGKRNARMAVGAAGTGLVNAEFQVRELDVLAEVTRRFIIVAERQEQLALAVRGRDLAERTVATVERRVASARSPHAELDRARIALDRARLDEQRAAAQLDTARIELAATWGADRTALDGRRFDAVAADLHALPEPGIYEDFATRLAGNPDLLRLATESRLREAELRLARTARRADLTVALGVRRLEASNDEALVASVAMPLFASRRAIPAIEEAQAHHDLAGAQYRAAEVRLRTVLYGLHRSLHQEVAMARTVERELLPRAEEALRETRYAYERGRYSFLEMVDAQREFLDLQAVLIDACVQAHLLRTEIERLTLEPLNRGTP